MIGTSSPRVGRNRRQHWARLSALAFATSIVASTVGLIVDNPVASASPIITSVTFSGNAQYPNPVITVNGSGFGTESSLGSPSAPGCSATGSDYPSNNMTFQNTTGIIHWIAGPPGACIGFFILKYTDTQIIFKFGSNYNGYNDLNNGTGYSMTVLGANLTGTVTYAPPSGWSATTNYTGNPLTSVSCPSSTFCVGVDNQGDAGVGNNGSISDSSIDSGHSLNSVSCPEVNFCVTVDNNGSAFFYNGSSWVGPFTVNSGADLVSVSCTAMFFCAAVEAGGNTWIYNGSHWTEFVSTDGNSTASISCASSSFCVAVDTVADYYIYNGSSLSSPNPTGGSYGFNSISCPSTTYCAAVDFGGDILSFDGTSWAAPVQIDANVTTLQSISCPVAGYCVAGDATGVVFTVSSGQVVAAGNVDPGNIVDGISCPSASFCIAVTSGGSAAVFSNAPTPNMTDVSFSGSVSSPTITVSGSGFGVQADLGNPQPPGLCGGTGSDYNNDAFFLTDNTHSWAAGVGPGDCVGVSISSYTNNQIVFTLGSYYTTINDHLAEGDSFSMTVLGSAFTGTVSYPVSYVYSCFTPGVGTQNVNTGLDLIPAPPSAADVPPSSLQVNGTYQTAPIMQADIPAAEVNYDINTLGVSYITISSVSFDLLADDSSGNPSPLVTPTDADISATNLPQTFQLVPNTPIDYELTYSQANFTAIAPGTVYFYPGSVNATVASNLGSGPTSCTPPAFTTSGTPTMTVVSAPTTPAPQAPANIPPVQATVTSGGDSGWTVTVTNTGTGANATATGVTVGLTASDGLPTPPAFDIAGMSRTEKGCSSAGPGTATCSIGTLVAGASVSLSVLTSTAGLPSGTVTTVTANVSANGGPAPNHGALAPHGNFSTSGLGPVTVVKPPRPGTVITVAAPGVKVINTIGPLSPTLPDRVTLLLPKKEHKSAIGNSSQPAGGLGSHKAVGNPLVGGPAVGATADWLTSTQDPGLCQAAAASLGGTTCTPAEVKGNFCSYKDKTKPVTATISIMFNSLPGGTTSVPLYMEKDAETVVNGVCQPHGGTTPPVVGPLPTCGKAKTGYPTPCVAKVLLSPKPKVTTANVTVTWTVYFVGVDPRMA